MKKIISMMFLWENVKAAFNNEKGQGMVEYGLILALIAVAVVTALQLMGTTLSGMFDTVRGSL